MIWLLDGVLQYQPFMFSKGFPQMLAGASSGNPAAFASPITWSATFIDHHLVAVNAVFATVQLALGLGIAWRPTARLALGTSVAWALGVWWFGEGLGSVLTGNAWCGSATGSRRRLPHWPWRRPAPSQPLTCRRNQARS